MWLAAKANALSLSQRISGVAGRGIPRSCMIYESQRTSATACAIAQYSASAVDQETVDCFFADHKMILLPKKVQYPEVKRFVVEQLAQSPLVKANNCSVELDRSCKPRDKLP